MAVEGCGKFLKYAVFFFNFLIFVGGCAVLGVGIWIAVDEGATKKIGEFIGSNMYSTAGYLLIACGAILFILGFLGCCGAIKESKCMLGTFFALLFLIFIILLVGGILAVVFQNTVKSELKKQIENIFTKNYGAPGKDKETKAVDDFQSLIGCCGQEGDFKSNTSWAVYKLTTWYEEEKTKAAGVRKYVPNSCCKKQDNATISECTGMIDTPNAPPRHDSPTVPNEALYGDGCYTSSIKFLEGNIPIIAGVGIGIAVLMILAMTFAICLCRSIEED